MPKSIKFLACVDHRDESKVALRLSCMKAQSRGGAVDMIHVITPADFQAIGAVADRMREEQKTEAEKFLATLANEAATTYGVAPRALLREGEIGEEIVKVASADADIICVVIGIAHQNNSRGSLASWLAAQLGGKLLTPLLMVPGNLTDEQLKNLI
jgi:hypothetical protein